MLLVFVTRELRWDFFEEEMMQQYSRDKCFPQLRTKIINPVGEPRNTSLAAPAHKQQILATQGEKRGCQSLDGYVQD